MFALVFYLILWFLVLQVAVALFGKWAYWMIGISAFVTFIKWLGPRLTAYGEVLQKRDEEKAAAKLQEDKEAGRIVALDDWRES